MFSSFKQIISAPNNAANCFEHENTRNSVLENYMFDRFFLYWSPCRQLGVVFLRITGFSDFVYRPDDG
jgi:hypothetical protein